MPNRNRGRRGAGRGERGMAMGRSQTPARVRPVQEVVRNLPPEDPIVVLAQEITESQVVSNLHETSQDHRNTIKQLKERIQELTKQIKKKNKEISNYRGLEQKVASLQNKIERMETPKIQKLKPTHKDIVDMCIESMKKGKKMSDVFGETLMKIIKDSMEELILKELGFPEMIALTTTLGILKEKGILKTGQHENMVSVHIPDVEAQKQAYIKNVEEAVKLGYVESLDVEKGQVKWACYTDGNKKTYTLDDLKSEIVSLARRIDYLLKENEAYEKIIENDDKLFQDCENYEDFPEWTCNKCVSECKGCEDCQ